MEEKPVTANDPVQGLRDVERLAARAASGRPVTIIAVSKTHGIDRIRQLLRSGHRVFGENRVQEAAQKFPALREEFPDLELHLIGPLQTNKVKEAVALFDVIQTIDRPKLAEALDREVHRQGRAMQFWVQVNIGKEIQKSGLAPGEVGGFLSDCPLVISGLMCIPPLGKDPVPYFKELAAMAARNGLPCLSMGMSGDFESAIRLGATHIRVGGAIFGSRPAL